MHSDDETKYISPEKFTTLPSEEQISLMKKYIEDLSTKERKILKIMIDNEMNVNNMDQ